MAERVWLATSVAGVKHYIDPATIKKDSKLRRAWVLQDQPRPDKFGTRSTKALLELDGVADRIRILDLVAYKGAMGQGGLDNEEPGPTPWQYVVPQTPHDVLLKYVCSK